MKKIILLSVFVLLSNVNFAQGNSNITRQLPSAERGKAVLYNSLGMGVLPSDYLMLGGNHISYRKIGFGVSWRLGIQNILLNKQGFSFMDYDTARANSWLTGNSKKTYSFGANFNVVIPITKKIPFYIGAGVVRQRQFAEVQTPFSTNGPEWILNTTETKFKFNFSGGVFIPIVNRLVLNIAYDYLPQTLFIGFAISSPYNYEDLDMW